MEAITNILMLPKAQLTLQSLYPHLYENTTANTTFLSFDFDQSQNVAVAGTMTSGITGTPNGLVAKINSAS